MAKSPKSKSRDVTGEHLPVTSDESPIAVGPEEAQVEDVGAEQVEELDQDGLTADDTGIAGSRARRSAAEVAPPGGLKGSLRFAWAVLTSMRTAIILLLLLAVAAIPGGILPQRPVNALAVTQYLEKHTTVGPFFNAIGMFDVYHAPWFSGIYMLLFVSLVGCILPRTAVYLRAAKAPAATPPRSVEKLSGAISYTSSGTPDDVLAARRRRCAPSATGCGGSATPCAPSAATRVSSAT
jgi:hypothetical protein